MIRIVLLLLLCSTKLLAQNISWESLPALPEAISNNAVATAWVDDTTYVYTFAGIDESKDWFGIHLRAYRMNTNTGVWDTLPPLPDANGGKIAASASTVKNKIYIIGGYHVASNYSETSSNKVHIYDPVANIYQEDGASIPVPIDDQVQAVWRDSLIFVVTGWSNTGNVTNVQIYNPAEDVWQSGTPVPNSSNWKVFGANGMIIEDTIYYAGGARSTGNFPPTSFFRKGYINPENPTEITWEGYEEPLAKNYRAGMGIYDGQGFWIGGSLDTYNFDGIAYNGSGGVAATSQVLFYDPEYGTLRLIDGGFPETMDMRSIAPISDNEFILIGGMRSGQSVTDQVIKVTMTNEVVNTNEPIESKKENIVVAPNPTSLTIQLSGSSFDRIQVVDLDGNIVLEKLNYKQNELDLIGMTSGMYLLKIWKNGNLIDTQKVVLSK